MARNDKVKRRQLAYIREYSIQRSTILYKSTEYNLAE